MSYINTINHVIKNRETYKKWDKEQDDFEAKRQALHKTAKPSQQELEKADSYGRTIINAINVMDEKSEEACSKAEMATGGILAVAAMPLVALSSFLQNKMSSKGLLATLTATSALIIPATFVGIATNLWATKVQVNASKVARNQARQEDLKDPKNFVLYNKTQIEEAKEKAKSIKELPKEKSLNPLQTLQKFAEDNIKYATAQVNEKQNKLSSIKLTPEQLKKAEKEKEIITHTIRKINDSAEEYTENIESSTSAFFSMGSVLGFVGGATGYLIGQNASKKSPMGVILGGAMSLTGFITPFIVQNQMKINAGKVARFLAKKELLNDPKNFIAYDKEQMNSVKDVKAKDQKKNFIQDFSDDMTFIFKSFKDSMAYNKYKKSKEYKSEVAFREALKGVKATDEQLKDAKLLQTKLFRTFEKVDSKSQEYSENMEFTTDAAMQIISASPYVAILSAVGLGGILNKTGILTKEKIENFTQNKATEMFKNPEKIEKFVKNTQKNLNSVYNKINDTKWGKKYLDSVITEWNNPEVKQLIETMLKSGSFSAGKILEKLPTTRNTAIAAGATLFLGAFGGIYTAIFAVNNYMTKLQKTAGKIGVMEAINELKDPVNFADQKS